MSHQFHQPHHLTPFFDIGIVESARAANAALNAPPAPVLGLDTLPDFLGKRLLTKTEGKVLACIVDGDNSKGVAQRLGISPRTVEDHKRAIIKKLRTYLGSNKGRNWAVLLTLHVYKTQLSLSQPASP